VETVPAPDDTEPEGEEGEEGEDPNAEEDEAAEE